MRSSVTAAISSSDSPLFSPDLDALESELWAVRVEALATEMAKGTELCESDVQLVDVCLASANTFRGDHHVPMADLEEFCLRLAISLTFDKWRVAIMENDRSMRLLDHIRKEVGALNERGASHRTDASTAVCTDLPSQQPTLDPSISTASSPATAASDSWNILARSRHLLFFLTPHTFDDAHHLLSLVLAVRLSIPVTLIRFEETKWSGPCGMPEPELIPHYAQIKSLFAEDAIITQSRDSYEAFYRTLSQRINRHCSESLPNQEPSSIMTSKWDGYASNDLERMPLFDRFASVAPSWNGPRSWRKLSGRSANTLADEHDAADVGRMPMLDRFASAKLSMRDRFPSHARMPMLDRFTSHARMPMLDRFTSAMYPASPPQRVPSIPAIADSSQSTESPHEAALSMYFRSASLEMLPSHPSYEPVSVVPELAAQIPGSVSRPDPSNLAKSNPLKSQSVFRLPAVERSPSVPELMPWTRPRLDADSSGIDPVVLPTPTLQATAVFPDTNAPPRTAKSLLHQVMQAGGPQLEPHSLQPDPLLSAASLEETGALRDVSHCAVSLTFLRHFVAESSFDAQWSTAEVVSNHIIPATISKRCRYVDTLGATSVGRPTYFISHRWTDNFKQLVERVAGFVQATMANVGVNSEGDDKQMEHPVCEDRNEVEVYLWLDIFAVIDIRIKQHVLTVLRRQLTRAFLSFSRFFCLRVSLGEPARGYG
jgi:hypothetical protein